MLEKEFMESSSEYKLQDLVENWWIKSNEVKAGSLIEAFVPHVDQMPYQFEPKGRTNPLAHQQADLIVKPLKVGELLQQVSLPVAGMPISNPFECWAAYRAKRRPCIVLAGPGDSIDKTLTRGMANHSTAPTLLVAPYYGITKSQKRSGFNSAFIERVRHIEYKQFLYDELPHSKGEPSILRFDHVMPIGANTKSYRSLGYELGNEAMQIFREYLQWNIFGGVESDAFILQFKEIVNC